MGDYYKLEGHTVVPCEDHEAWGIWWEKAGDKRIVAKTEVPMGDKSVEVATVFLSLNHSWDPNGPPIVFETMVFGGPNDGYCERYATWADAEAGHYAVVERCMFPGGLR